MKTQVIAPKGIESTVKFMGEEKSINPRIAELEVLIVKLKAKLFARTDELQKQINDAEKELSSLKK